MEKILGTSTKAIVNPLRGYSSSQFFYDTLGGQHIVVVVGGYSGQRINHANPKLAGNSRIAGQKLPLKPKHVRAIRVRHELAERHRDLVLFNMAIDSKFRGCGLVRLKVRDVFAAGQMKERASTLQSKTQKPVQFEITEGTRTSLDRWMEDPLMNGSEYLWPSRFHERLHISTRQYAPIVTDWVISISLQPIAYGTHNAADQSDADIQENGQSKGRSTFVGAY